MPSVGILCPIRFSCFSSGITNVALNLYDYLTEFGFQVHLLNILTGSDKKWFDDCSQLAAEYNVRNFEDIIDFKYDILIDIDAAITGERRRAVAKKVVVLFRKPCILNDIESIVYPANKMPHHLDDVDTILVYDYFSNYDIQYLQLLAPEAVIHKVPFLWRPKIVDAHYKETGFSHWLNTSGKGEGVWSPHVMESNMSNNSSCILPIVIFRQLALQKAFPFQEYTVHNMEQLNNSDYFRDNIKKNTEHEDLKGHFIGRQRVIDLVVKPKSCLLSHIRFLPFRPIHLDALWVGIPLIHNSVLLRELGNGLERFYYRDNDILDSVQSFKNMNSDFEQKVGFFTVKAQEHIRGELIARFAGNSVAQRNAWKTALGMTDLATPVITVSTEVPLVVSPVTPVSPVEVVAKPQPTKTYNVLFTDMWDDFNAEYNFFLLVLNESAKAKNVLVKGYSLETIDSNSPDLIIFGPFGESYRLFGNVPKMHFTGENSPPIWDTNVKLNVGYSLLERSDDSYMRLPLWMLEIDWFGADAERIVNPKPIPIDCVKTVSQAEKPAHQGRFCAFVVTNPLNSIRNESFFWLSSYKQVDSAGRLFNNIGDEIFAGRGGGGGELLKHEFLKKYKFCLTFENSSSEGYTTEKLLHAKAAGCIPIYWGDSKVARDFNDKGFINANGIRNAEDLISLVRDVDTNAEKYEQMYSEPLLDEYRFELARRRLGEFARRLWKIMDESVCEVIPKSLGATSTAEAVASAGSRGDGSASATAIATASATATASASATATVSASASATGSASASATATTPISTQLISAKINGMILVTFATSRFLPSLEMWLNIYNQHKQHISGITAQVYLGDDINDSVKDLLEKQYVGVLFRRLPSETLNVPNFQDFWEPQHFAWKIWLLNDIVQNGSFDGRLIFYMDVGALYVRVPFDYITDTVTYGISLLEDPRQMNRQWCSRDSCEAMNITEAEKSGQQIWAGGFMFIGGHAVPTKLFADALTFAKQRKIIVGPKWEGIGPDGKPFGHRHDQSILSILSARQNVHRYPLDKVYCDFSLRRTIRTNCGLYVHRGNFTQHKDFLPRISEAHVINLKRRDDRLKRFYTNHPNMEGPAIIDEACDGRAIQLTPMLHRLFVNNDFHWKKPILGCAMSHLKLWTALANEEASIENYLIMEDDVKFKPGWENIWKQAVESIPEDYDVLYLGGILPPNRAGYDQVIEQINPYWSRIREHSMFGQQQPNRYFHVCNYSYVLSKRGAKKILDKIIASGGYYTSADHMICNQVDFLNHYFLTPLVSGCYQDDDPKYANSEFNNFGRIDGFDSDLWNNDERFTEADRAAVPFDAQDPSFEKAIEDAFTQTRIIGTEVPEKAKEVLITKQTVQPVVAKEQTHHTPHKDASPLRNFYSIKPHTPTTENMMEFTWLTDLLTMEDGRVFGTPNKIVTTEIKHIDFDSPLIDNKPIFIVQRPHLDLYTRLFAKYEMAEKDFYVLHLSDEFASDNLLFYSFTHCKGIVRNYERDGLDTSKVVVIPLGYAKRTGEMIGNQINQTPSLPFRELVWSFRGTGWNNRREKVGILNGLGDSQCVFYNDWKDPAQAGREEYIGEVLNSKFVPCPGGMNPETFRLYEALELGAIPLYVREPGDDLYYKKLNETIKILSIGSWGDAHNFVKYMLDNPEIFDKYRTLVLSGWIETKKARSKDIKRVWDY